MKEHLPSGRHAAEGSRGSRPHRWLAWLTWVMAALLAVGTGPAAAEIVIAQVATKSGPLGLSTQGAYEGAKAYFDQVNAQGGIDGQRIRLVFEDDQYKASETIRLLNEVARRDKPVLFMTLVGSSIVQEVIAKNVLDDLKVANLSVFPGAESARRPGSPWIFHIHAGDRRQIRQIMKHVSTLGITRVALAYQEDPFGKNGMAYFDEAAAELKLQVAGRVGMEFTTPKVAEFAQKLKATGAQAYVMVLGRGICSSMIKELRALGDLTPVYAMSYVPPEAILEKVSLDQAVGVGIAQVLPDGNASKLQLTRDFRASMNKAGKQDGFTSAHMMGYVTARIAVEAIRRAGPNPSSAKVAATLRTLRMDLGGYAVNFTNGENVASEWVDIGVLGRNGRLMY